MVVPGKGQGALLYPAEPCLFKPLSCYCMCMLREGEILLRNGINKGGGKMAFPRLSGIRQYN